MSAAYETHPLAAAFPPQAPEVYAALVKDVAENGLSWPCGVATSVQPQAMVRALHFSVGFSPSAHSLGVGQSRGVDARRGAWPNARSRRQQ